jgi:hypothetical protein
VRATALYRYAGTYTPRRSSTFAWRSAESANIERLPSHRSSARPATTASPTNVTTNWGSGRPAVAGLSTTFGLSQYGHRAVRTPSNARVAPHCPHTNVTVGGGGDAGTPETAIAPIVAAR